MSVEGGPGRVPLRPLDASSALRSRGARAAVGYAQPRPVVPVVNFGYTSVARRYPFYSPGFGWSFGFSAYNPWLYHRYGYGFGYYDPWFAPYGYYGSPYAYGELDDPWMQTSSPSAWDDQDDPRPEPTGSIRLKVNPRSARVYIDGALAGTADDFDGLSHHLELEAGTHTLELRADGYDTYSGPLSVSPNRTLTERQNLKKR